MGVRGLLLAAIEPLTERVAPSHPLDGCIALYSVAGIFKLHWFAYSSRRCHHLELTKRSDSDFLADHWDDLGNFTIDCQQLELLVFDPQAGAFTLHRRSTTVTRTFQFQLGQLFLVGHFVKTLLYRGVGLLTSQRKYAISFFEKLPHESYFPTTVHANIATESCADIISLWAVLERDYAALLLELDRLDSLECESLPLFDIALLYHQNLMEKIEEYRSGIPQYTGIEFAEWASLFDRETSRLIDPVTFQARVYFAGVSDELVPLVLPFALGLYPLDSTLQDREEIDHNCASEFEKVRYQFCSQKEAQIENNSKISYFLRVALNDVSRTDRCHPTFREDDSPGLKLLETILQIYVFHNPRIGYLQGMNDLLVPVILANLRPDGTVESLSKVYWEFYQMLDHIGHVSFLTAISGKSASHITFLFDFMTKISPIMALWLKKVGLGGFRWILTDYILVFKRSLPRIWDLWLKLHVAPEPRVALPYFIVGFLIDVFGTIARQKGMCLVKMMEEMPRLLCDLDVGRVSTITMWLFKEFPVQLPVPEAAAVTSEFFPLG
jgi:hypothetical protein